MVGKVTYPDGRTATLRDDLRWETTPYAEDGPRLDAIYNEDDWPTTPDRGEPGHPALHDLVGRVGGVLEFEDKPGPPAGAIY